MIGSLQGIIDYREAQFVILSVGGVGYKVLVPATVTTAVGEQTKLFTHTHVREDVLELYGFVDPLDLKLFEYLISVSGVGCKTALGVYSVGSRKEIINAIIGNDVSFFTSVPRLGKKNAQKIIIELKNKLGGEGDVDLSTGESESSEVVQALKSFGFTPAEARSAIKSLNGKGETVGEKVRLALKYLGK
jgi:holliday junction DNA helicase RuvA